MAARYVTNLSKVQITINGNKHEIRISTFVLEFLQPVQKNSKTWQSKDTIIIIPIWKGAFPLNHRGQKIQTTESVPHSILVCSL